jgi:hypothetical protein
MLAGGRSRKATGKSGSSREGDLMDYSIVTKLTTKFELMFKNFANLLLIKGFGRSAL